MVTKRVGRNRTTGSGPAVAVLLDLVDEGFDRRSWHGTNLRGALRGLTPARAVWRPGRERHNIWEIVTHAAYWKYAVRRRLSGEKRGSFTLPGSNFFPAPRRGTQTAWRDNVALLTSEHRLLRETVARLEGRDLANPVGRGQDTVGGLVRGSAAHDLYHAGQICITRARSS